MGKMERDRGGREKVVELETDTDRKHREDMKKLWWLKVKSAARWAEPPYLGNKKSDSRLGMSDSLVLVHFFNNMWPFFHSTGD